MSPSHVKNLRAFPMSIAPAGANGCQGTAMFSAFSLAADAMRIISLAALSLVLAACATPRQSRITEAAITPLSDLNLVYASIPAVLVESQKRPYAVPADQGCSALSAEIRLLDEALGPDLDSPPSASDTDLVELGAAMMGDPATDTNKGADLIERGTTMIGDAAVGTIKGAAEGVLPFRGWIRKLSGAERRSREVTAAIAAGSARRAFLKGMIAGRGCS